MPMPAEFKRAYRDEAHFRKAFLHRLLRRLGFAIVLDYHGVEEFGKDLVFAELDRFGTLRYHALQARFQSSIGLQGAASLIEACRQAFANPFVHPATGQEEVISSFYAVNAGSISPQARHHFFASLVPHVHRNAFLLDGLALVHLDRWSSVADVQATSLRLDALAAELDLNAAIVDALFGQVKRLLDGPAEAPPPVERLFTAAVSHYLAHPFVRDEPDLTRDYLLAAVRLNHTLDALAAVRRRTHYQYLLGQACDTLERLPELARRVAGRLEPFATAFAALVKPIADD